MLYSAATSDHVVARDPLSRERRRCPVAIADSTADIAGVGGLPIIHLPFPAVPARSSICSVLRHGPSREARTRPHTRHPTGIHSSRRNIPDADVHSVLPVDQIHSMHGLFALCNPLATPFATPTLPEFYPPPIIVDTLVHHSPAFPNKCTRTSRTNSADGFGWIISSHPRSWVTRYSVGPATDQSAF